jgi:hypothetical protein
VVKIESVCCSLSGVQVDISLVIFGFLRLASEHLAAPDLPDLVVLNLARQLPDSVTGIKMDKDSVNPQWIRVLSSRGFSSRSFRVALTVDPF